MSENKSKPVNPLNIPGIKTFERNENAPDFVLCDGVLTPKLLIDHLKTYAKEIEGAKGEYNGNVQFKFQILKNDYGSYNFKFNTYQKKSETISQPSTEPIMDDDLPF